MNIFKDLIQGGIQGILDSGSTIIDKFVTTPEQKMEAQKMLLDAELQAKKQTFEAEQSYMKDRASARDLGKTDPWTPRILTMVYTIGFFALTTFMLNILFGNMKTDIPSHILMFISTIFGSFSTIMVQIISYYFGASKGGDEQSSKMSDSFKSTIETKINEDKKK